jgi:hypothetical protein
MAKLPESEKRVRIIDMLVGQTRFVVPWALWVDRDDECFLNEDFDTSFEASGTAQLKVTKVEGGYIAFIYQTDHRWTPRERHDFVDTDEHLCYGKVIGFELNKIEEAKLSLSLKEQLEQAIAEENFELAKELQKQMQ